MSTELDQEKIDENVPAVLKEDQGKIDEDVPDILLKESELKQEGSDSTSVIIISDAEDEIDLTCPTPKTVPMAVPINGLCLNNLNKLDSEVVEEMRCSSEPVASLSIIDLPQPRRYESVPKDTRKCPVIIDYIVIQDSDTECENALEQKPKRPLKRKRSLIPTNIEVENTRKTMKPGPKSKTRNIVTVHQMITEAKMRGKDVTLDFSDTSEDEIDLDSEDGSSEEASNEDEEEELLQIDLDDYEDSENSNETDDENEMDEDEEEELPTIKIIGDCITITSSDDEADNLEPEVGELIVGNEASTSSDNFAMEILLSLSNEVTINKKSSETLDKSDETDVLENVIDSNKMVNDNKALENNAIEQNKIEDKNVKSHEIKNGE
ncbi:kinesin-related protein 4-like [Myzus persicae]|uniref:kinesin-related protein 4-like n=1 Tax=Myzus persicae TaxID=13164 RepID=UPI000B939681|nr:kinesin-related protein 4-like [Myzus persicae]XP_022181934.1 kinesin-related protein 4-like [Myzus persicae]